MQTTMVRLAVDVQADADASLGFFIDGVLHETIPLDPGSQQLTLHVPNSSLVRMSLFDAERRIISQLSFAAPEEPRTFGDGRLRASAGGSLFNQSL